MNTKPTNDPDAACQIERSNDQGETYLCCKPSRIVWLVAGVQANLCRHCFDWLQTLESLDQLGKAHP